MATETSPAAADATAYLIFDTESIPDGVLLSRCKYSDAGLTPEEAVSKAQHEARAASSTGSDFLPVTYQIPIAICVARVSADYQLQAICCLDKPHFRTAEIVRKFWVGYCHYKARLVSFNGRGFDMPLLELSAFRYGIAVPKHFCQHSNSRHRYRDEHIDLMEFFTNYGAIRFTGGLDLLSKLLGKPGKTELTGLRVYQTYCAGGIQQINEYCSFDVLDTYFVFLRTRVLTGEMTLEQEKERVAQAKDWLTRQCEEQPHLGRYLERWGDWVAWP